MATRIGGDDFELIDGRVRYRIRLEVYARRDMSEVTYTFYWDLLRDRMAGVDFLATMLRLRIVRTCPIDDYIGDDRAGSGNIDENRINMGLRALKDAVAYDS